MMGWLIVRPQNAVRRGGAIWQWMILWILLWQLWRMNKFVNRSRLVFRLCLLVVLLCQNSRWISWQRYRRREVGYVVTLKVWGTAISFRMWLGRWVIVILFRVVIRQDAIWPLLISRVLLMVYLKAVKVLEQELGLKEQAQQEQALLLEQEESKLGRQLLRIQVVPLRLQGVMLLLRVQITMSSTSL